MKPYGKKPELAKGKVQGHTSDTCLVCNNDDWDINKRRERSSIKNKLNKVRRDREEEKYNF